MRFTIVGGGNIGTQFAAHCSAHGHNTTVYTSQVESFPSSVKTINDKGECVLSGKVDRITYDSSVAADCDVMFITTPSFTANETARKLMPYIRNNTRVFFIPGSGGMEWAFKPLSDKGVSLYGLQRVPSVARVKDKGTVYCEGYRKELFIASLPRADAEFGRMLIESLFDTPCAAMDNYLNVTLVPSNPILHTVRLYSLFKDYTRKKVYNTVPLFYEEWTDEASELLLACDEELQSVCRKISRTSSFDLSYVRSLKDHYESYTVRAMTEKIRSIKGFKGIPTPCVKTENGFIPDFDSRYFTADFPYGLRLLRQIADICGVAVPTMQMLSAWYNETSPRHKMFDFGDYGVYEYKQLHDFYVR